MFVGKPIKTTIFYPLKLEKVVREGHIKKVTNLCPFTSKYHNVNFVK